MEPRAKDDTTNRFSRTKTAPTTAPVETKKRRKRANSLDSNPKKTNRKSSSKHSSRRKHRHEREKKGKSKERSPKVAKNQGEEVPLNQWFEHVVGVDETTFTANREKYIEHEGDGYLLIKNPTTGKGAKAGKFELIMYGDMLLDVGVSKKEQKLQKKRSYPLIEIVTALDKESVRFVDVAYLQSLPENRNALFQVASNFNGIEAVTETSYPDSPDFTTKYFTDRTQGPAASISAGAGAITRVHAAFFNEKKPPKEWGQTKDNQINFVKNLSKHFPIVNGYVVYTGNEPKFPKNRKGKQWKKLLANYYVAYHKDQEVLLGHRKPDTYETQTDPDQVIDQVCCAAVNMLQGAKGINNRKIDIKMNKMCFILQAAYDSTYLSAVYYQRKVVYLTLVGGGAFGNDVDTIWSQILASHKKWARHTKSQIEKVVLIMFTPRANTNEWLLQMQDDDIPYSYVGYKEGKKQVLDSFDPSEVIKL